MMPAVEQSLGGQQPALAKQWHVSRNATLTPFDVFAGSNTVVWWLCGHGHEWRARVLSRVNGNGCPTCYLLPPVGESLDERIPTLAAQWHPMKNGELTPAGVTCGSGRVAWWLDEHGHEWRAQIASRANGNGCPTCAKQRGHRTSLMEEALRAALIAVYPQTHPGECDLPRSDGKRGGRWYVDFFIPTPTGGVVIEYDGETRTHGTPQGDQRDLRKSEDLRSQGFHVIRLRPHPLALLHHDDLHVPTRLNKRARAPQVIELLEERLSSIEVPPDPQ